VLVGQFEFTEWTPEREKPWDSEVYCTGLLDSPNHVAAFVAKDIRFAFAQSDHQTAAALNLGGRARMQRKYKLDFRRR
jgi:hypothetical protein